ncbi:MAG: VWA domain-containing protein [Hyphomonas sp.]
MDRSIRWAVAGCLALGVLAGCSSRYGGAPGPVRTSVPSPVEVSVPSPSGPAATGPYDRSATEIAVAGGAPAESPAPPVQAGLLTAGDYDDVLNPELYKAYLDKVLQGELKDQKLPYVDANRRIAVRLVDRLGKPVPLADLTLLSGEGETVFPLQTGANGLTYLYPAYDALKPGMGIRAGIAGAEPVTRELTADLLETGGEIVIELGADRTKPGKLDLLLTIDATGSMSDEMSYLQKELEGILDRVTNANPGLDIRAGLIVYRDRGDEYVVRDFAFTGDFGAFRTNLNNQRADGGGDFPEAMHEALRRGLDFTWRADAVKVNLLVADAPPHAADIAATWDAALVSRTRGIHIVPLAASGVDKTAEFLMRASAQITGGRYVFLTDDSGIGNPHAEPEVDCYVVTRLDSLLMRVLSSLVRGERVEPEGAEVIRTVGNYRAGVCKVGQAGGQ